MSNKKSKGVSRRRALGLIGGVAAATPLLNLVGSARAQGVASPAVRKKVNLSFWTYADNPSHQKMLVDAVSYFNNSQSFITVQMDASARTFEMFQKIAAASAAGAAPDVSTFPHYGIQQYYDSGILHPIEDYFNKWDQKDDFFPAIREAMRCQPGQPALYLPGRQLTFVLWYRADWFDEAKLAPPKTFDEFLAAARTLHRPPNRFGYLHRGGDYYGLQVFEPILGSAGVNFVDASGKVDIDSPKAIEAVEKWISMYTKDKSVQPTALSDKYPQLFALMEQGLGAMWIYGTHASPQLTAALGDRIQVVPTPRIDKPCTEITPVGEFMLSTSKEKDASWEFLMSMASAPSALALGPGRGYLPVRKSIAEYPEVKNNKHMKVGSDEAANWWMPPLSWKHFLNYQDKIPPYWQEALQQKISTKDLLSHAARMLRGEE